MFQLRDDHLRAMGQVAEDNFVTRAVAHLRSTYPETTKPMSDEDLSGRVRRGRQRAAVYGLSSEKQVMCFLDSGVILGETFDVNPAHAWTRPILTDPQKSADERAGTLLGRTIQLAHSQRRAATAADQP